MIVRDANDPVVNELWYDVLNKIGASSISDKPRHEAVSLSIKQLKANKGLCLFCDQNKTDGVYVDFFGLPAGTVEGPALLAHRLRSPVLCAFIIRKALFKHKIVIIPLLDIEYTDNRQSDIKNITKRYTKIIEDFVRKYPNQWWWVHNRWKGMHKLKKRFK
jgi:KDO2-lipid IV(A) lauroyltransferase